jgi:hypothetical protein
LQHPRESKKKTIGTVPLIKLVLGQGCEVIVSPTNGKRNSGRYFNDHPKVLEAAMSGEMSVNKIVPLSIAHVSIFPRRHTVTISLFYSPLPQANLSSCSRHSIRRMRTARKS